MRLPLQIAFHNLRQSDEIEAKLRAEAERLDDFHDRIMSCRVVVDVPHRHHKEGNLYQVRIDMFDPSRGDARGGLSAKQLGIVTDAGRRH